MRLSVLAFGIAVPCFCSNVSAPGPQVAQPTTEYRNSVFGFSVKVPARYSSVGSTPPNPDHGIRLALNAVSLLWVDASYAETASSQDELEYMTKGCATTRPTTSQLGGQTALSFTLHCADLEGKGSGYWEIVRMVVRETKTRSPIRFLVALRAKDRRALLASQNVFTQVADSFRFTE